MGTEPKVSRIDAQRNREMVIDAALDLLASKPNASMAVIAAQSGVGRTTVYRHFPTREDLIRALFERIVSEARAVTTDVIGSDRPARETLFNLGPAIIGIGRRFQFLEGVRQLGNEVILESTLDPDDPVRRFLVEAREQGAVRRDLPIQWMIRSINNLATVAMVELGAERMDSEEAGRLLGQTFVRSFASQPP